jgi:hypothetical protein
MLKTGRLIAAMAIATLALPAMAGSWPTLPAERKAPARTTQPAPAKPAAASVTQPKEGEARAGDGFEYVGGESGWRLAQHKYVWTAGRFVHSNECDHAIRTAKAPTPAEVESGRSLSPGA